MGSTKPKAFVKENKKIEKTSEEDLAKDIVEKIFPTDQSKVTKKVSLIHNCDNCTHYDVCKFKEDTKDFSIDILPNIFIDCKYYNEGE